MGNPDNIPKMRSDDRIFVLERTEGTKNSAGIVDNRLFTDGNKLHAKMDPETTHWALHYEKGLIPPVLQQRFTSWNKCLDFVKTYFERRNVKIKEILD